MHRSNNKLFNTNLSHRYIQLFITPLLLLFFITPAFAQISAGVTLKDDDWFRGRSISQRQPVIQTNISYDTQSGIYAEAAIATTFGNEANGILNYTAIIGYATRIDSDLSIDNGTVLTAYTDRYSGMANDTFVEFYSGLTYRNITGRIRYSPNYQEQGLSTIYTEINTAKRLTKTLNVIAHAGLLSQIGGNGSLGDGRNRYDLQIGLAKDFGQWSITSMFHISGTSGDNFSARNNRNAVIFSLSRNF